MSILCRLGLHSWKPICTWKTYDWCKPFILIDQWQQIACKCRRCGKRVDM